MDIKDTVHFSKISKVSPDKYEAIIDNSSHLLHNDKYITYPRIGQYVRDLNGFKGIVVYKEADKLPHVIHIGRLRGHISKEFEMYFCEISTLPFQEPISFKELLSTLFGVDMKGI